MLKKIMLSFLFAAAAFGSELDESGAKERSGLSIECLKIYHQEEWRNMSINLEFDTVQDYQHIKSHVKKFLENYSNPADFWEIMNVNLTHSLLQEFPEIHVLKSKISLDPDRTLLFPRASTVQYDTQKEVLDESFEFTKLHYQICNETFQSLDLHVAFDLKANPDRYDYPDYQWLDQAMNEFFKEHPMSFSKWSELKPELEGFLLKRFPTITKINIDVKVSVS